MADSSEFIPRSEYRAHCHDSMSRYLELDQRLHRLADEVGGLKVAVASLSKYWAAIDAHLEKDAEQEKRIRNIEFSVGEIKAQFRVWMAIAIVAIPLIDRILERFVAK